MLPQKMMPLVWESSGDTILENLYYECSSTISTAELHIDNRKRSIRYTITINFKILPKDPDPNNRTCMTCLNAQVGFSLCSLDSYVAYTDGSTTVGLP